MTFVSGGSLSFTDEQANLSVFKHQSERRQAVESEMMCLLFGAGRGFRLWW